MYSREKGISYLLRHIHARNLLRKTVIDRDMFKRYKVKQYYVGQIL